MPVDDYVYDYYTVKNNVPIADDDASNPFPLCVILSLSLCFPSLLWVILYFIFLEIISHIFSGYKSTTWIYMMGLMTRNMKVMIQMVSRFFPLV